MTRELFMGIDGGGSGLRLILTDFDQIKHRSHFSSSVNPNLIGRDRAKQLIQDSIEHTLMQSGRSSEDIAAAAIGIAGASNEHSCAWLLDTLKSALPESLPVPSSDLEIALVGALAQRHGILVLSGTGSAVLGIAPDGLRHRIGGWGYLLGDPGSAYWIGMQVLSEITQHHDQAATESMAKALTDLDWRILHALELAHPRDLVSWLHGGQEPLATKVAGTGKIGAAAGRCGDFQAASVLQRAAQHLALATNLLRQELDYADAPIAFAGGLLSHDNYLSADLTRRLGLDERPIANYTPAAGAALLAKMEWQRAITK